MAKGAKTMKLSIYLPLALLTACASGPCNNQVKTTDSATVVTPQSASSISEAESSRIKIYKADGSRQCGQGKAIALSEMQKQLTKAGIKVLSSTKGPDGMMHTQVCGAATGTANIYEISSADLKKAEKLGFSRLEN